MVPGYLDRNGMRRVVRLFPDYGRAWPLWESPTTAPGGEPCTTPQTYRLTEGLANGLRPWNARWESAYHPERGWSDAALAMPWAREGERLAVELATEVAALADVGYEPWPVSAEKLYLAGPTILVRPCREKDIALLTAAEPPGADVAVRLYARQQRGESVYLLGALRQPAELGRTGSAAGKDEPRPAGHAELLLGEAPELRHLQIEPSVRGRGLGTAIVRAAEYLLGSGTLTLGVGLDNTAARALYERLGYRGTGEVTTTTYRFVDHLGEHEATETNEAMTKTIGVRMPSTGS